MRPERVESIQVICFLAEKKSGCGRETESITNYVDIETVWSVIEKYDVGVETCVTRSGDPYGCWDESKYIYIWGVKKDIEKVKEELKKVGVAIREQCICGYAGNHFIDRLPSWEEEEYDDP